MNPIELRGRVLGALLSTQPLLFRKIVRDTLRRLPSLTLASEALGVGRRTLERWIANDPELAKGIKLPGRGQPRKEEGK